MVTVTIRGPDLYWSSTVIAEIFEPLVQACGSGSTLILCTEVKEVESYEHCSKRNHLGKPPEFRDLIMASIFATGSVYLSWLLDTAIHHHKQIIIPYLVFLYMM